MSLNVRVTEISRQNSFPTMDLQKYEILLFAEDVVSYLMNTKLMWRHTGFCSTNAAPKAGEYRDLVYNGFSEIVKKAVDVLFDTHLFFIQRQYISIVEAGEIGNESLKIYAKFLWEEHFADGIDAIRFLRFCVVLTGLAGAFYLEGLKKSPDYVVQIIVYHFPRAECLKVTWNVLNRAALHYLKDKTRKSYSQLFDSLDEDTSSYMDFKNGYTCNCFKTDLKGASFKKLYAIRENILRYHFMICVRANFAEAYKQNFMRRTEDYKEYPYPTHISRESKREDQHFSGDQNGMSAILKISQAARLSEISSENYNYAKCNNKVIPSNRGCHTDKTCVPEISRSAKCAEKSTDPSSKSPVKVTPKQTNNQADSVIFKIPKSVKRFKMSDSGNVNNGNKVIPLNSDIYNYPTYQSDSYHIAKLSEMVQDIGSLTYNGNASNGNRVSPLKSDIYNYPNHLTASYNIAEHSERFQNLGSMCDNGNGNNGKVITLKSGLYNYPTHQPESYPIRKHSVIFQNIRSMSVNGNVNNGNKAISLKSDLYDHPTYHSDSYPTTKPSEMFQDTESFYDNGNDNNGNKVIPLKSDLNDYSTCQPDDHPITKLSEMFQNIESILNKIQTLKNRQKLE